MDTKAIFDYIQSNKPVALLAPSFPVDFEYPEIIDKLKSLGFSKVVELTYAAKLINNQYHDHLKNNPEQTRICSNCPTVVQYINNKFPQHKNKLMPVASPMIITSRLIKKKYGSETKTFFIGPCLVKKIEAKKTGEVDEAITFKELQEIIDYSTIQGIKTDINKESDFDDIYNNYTKIYPLTGGVAQTIHYKDILKKEEIIICEGIKEINAAIKEIETNKQIKFIDPLMCPGGCIGGPGIISKEPTEAKIKKIKSYKKEIEAKIHNPHIGKKKYIDGLEMKNSFI